MTAAVDTWQTCIMCASQKEQLLYTSVCARLGQLKSMYAAVQSVRISHRRIAYYELHPGRNRDADAESQHYHQTAAVNSFAFASNTEYGIRNTELLIHGRVSTKTKTPAAVAPLPTAGAKKQKKSWS